MGTPSLRQVEDARADREAATLLTVLALVACVVFPTVALGTAASLTLRGTLRAFAFGSALVALAVLIHDPSLWAQRFTFRPEHALVGPLSAEALRLAHHLHGRILLTHLKRQKVRKERPITLVDTAELADLAAGNGPTEQIFLGVTSGDRPFFISRDELATHTFVPGLPGTGKTTTLIRLVRGAMQRGYAVVVIDAKGGGGLFGALQAVRSDLLTVDPLNPETLRYDPCVGTPVAVANKLIGAFSYGDVAEVYKLAALAWMPRVAAAILATGDPITLSAMAEAFSKGGLARLGRNAGGDWAPKLAQMEQERDKDRIAEQSAAGLRYRLEALAGGTYSHVFEGAEQRFDWGQATSRPEMLSYIGLPIIAASEDTELFARVIIQDLKQLTAARLRQPDAVPTLLMFDEFAALKEAEQIVDLVNMSREAKLPLVIASQNFPENPRILSVCLGAGLILAHQLVVTEAETMAAVFGTRDSFEVTDQIDYETGFSQRGSVRSTREFIVHPDKIKDLPQGQVYVRSRASKGRPKVHVYKDA